MGASHPGGPLKRSALSSTMFQRAPRFRAPHHIAARIYSLLSGWLRTGRGRTLTTLGLLAAVLLTVPEYAATSTTVAAPAATQHRTAAGGFAFAVSPDGLTLREYSYTDSFFTGSRTVQWPRSQTYIDVTLTQAPTANVTLPISSTNTAEATVAPSQLIFTPTNWNVTQRITVSSVYDGVKDGNQPFSVVTGPAVSADPSYQGGGTQNFAGTNQDNEFAVATDSSGNSFGITDEGLIYTPDLAQTIQRIG